MFRGFEPVLYSSMLNDRNSLETGQSVTSHLEVLGTVEKTIEGFR